MCVRGESIELSEKLSDLREIQDLSVLGQGACHNVVDFLKATSIPFIF